MYESITQLVAGADDGDTLLRLARAHGVLPLFSYCLTEIEGQLPEPFLRVVRAECQQGHARNLVLASELLALLRSFERESIPALPFKGVLLGALLYGDLRHRPPGDIDILIFPNDRERALAVARTNGFELLTPVNQNGSPVEPDACEYQLRKTLLYGTIVELCWRLTPPSFHNDFGMEALWPNRQTSLLLGSRVPDLDPGHLLIALCLHGAKHQWNRLFWIADVARLLLISPGLGWDRVDSLARGYGLWRTLGVGVLLAHDVAGVSVPEAVLVRFQRNATVRRMAAHLLKHLFDEVITPFPGLPLEVEMVPFRDRVRRMARAVCQSPNHRDRKIVKLPPRLEFLYFLIRPLRLMWEYGIRTGGM